MAIFHISVINQHFEANEDHDLPSLEVAQDQAIRGALEIGLDEVGVASPLFAAEVKIASEGEQVARYVVSVGVSPLR